VLRHYLFLDCPPKQRLGLLKIGVMMQSGLPRFNADSAL
jgi:hypothetical protein